MTPDHIVEIEENTPEIEALQAHPQLCEDYDVLRLIGRGAQGTVYLARQRETETLVAIKALSFREISDWKASDLFMREVALLRSMRVNGTPQYLGAIDATANPHPYYFLIQEYIEGKSLQAMLDEGQTFAMEDVIGIALAIAPILEQLRQFSPPIVHRDIKPSNIMLTPDRRIYLVDFGAAMFNERSTGGSTFAGTAGYMAPEQCMGTSGPESDIYGLGATLIHLATGIAPYKMQTKEMKLQFKRHLPDSTPEWFIQLLDTMVSPYPCKRVKDLHRIVKALRTLPGSKPSANAFSNVPIDTLNTHLLHSNDVMRRMYLANMLPDYPNSYSRIIPGVLIAAQLVLIAILGYFAPYFLFDAGRLYYKYFGYGTIFFDLSNVDAVLTILSAAFFTYFLAITLLLNKTANNAIRIRNPILDDAFEKFLKEKKIKEENQSLPAYRPGNMEH